MKKLKQFSLLITLFLFLITISCKKKVGMIKHSCPNFSIVLTSPYQDPVWHPSGSLIGFNHTPLKEINYSYGKDCPLQANYMYKTDSVGFWLINADGTNQHRILPYELQCPAWSPDGKWITFSKNAQIYKMPFDGNEFDENNIIQLTNMGRNFFPAWSPNGDNIAFDSDTYSPTKLKFIWTMQNDGSSKKRISFVPDEGENRMPTWLDNSRLIFQKFQKYIGTTYPEVYVIDVYGNSLIRLTNNTSRDSYPRYSSIIGKIAFISQSNVKGEGTQLFTMNPDGSNTQRLTNGGAINFSWSPSGKIVYVNFDYQRLDAEKGTLWTMYADGTNKKQLTTNNFITSN